MARLMESEPSTLMAYGAPECTRVQDEEADAVRLIGLLEGDLELGTIAHLDDSHRAEHAGHESVVETCDCRVGGGFEHIPAGDLPFSPRTRDCAFSLATFQSSPLCS